MAKKVVLSLRPQAVDDIENAFNYLVENAGIEIAERFYDEVRMQSQALVRHPESGAKALADIPGYNRVTRNKVLTQFEYIIYYAIDKTPNTLTIDIIRILHASQDRWTIMSNST